MSRLESQQKESDVDCSVSAVFTVEDVTAKIDELEKLSAPVIASLRAVTGEKNVTVQKSSGTPDEAQEMNGEALQIEMAPPGA